MKTVLTSTEGRVVATLDGDTLRKRVIEAKHKLHTPLAWCIDKDVIEQAVEHRATRIEIVATDTGKTYRATMDEFLENAKKMNRGHNDQLMLPLRYWATGDELQLTLGV